MATCKLRSLLCVLCLTHSAVCFQWTSDIGNDAIRFVCRGHNLVLPWNFTTTNETTYTILMWYYQGLSEEVIAAMTRGHFVPSRAFSGRVEFLHRGGIILKSVIPGDRGNYSVELMSHAGELERQNAVVEISDAPSTSSGDLDLQQDKTAVHNDTTGEWSVQLTCGHFTSLGQPSIDIVWTTPTGGTQPSTNYSGGNFHLILPNPVRGGNYSCAIAPQSPAASCLPGSSPLFRKAVVNVDEVVTRLTLLEVRQVDLLAGNLLQSETNANQSSYIHHLEDSDANLTRQIHSLTSQVHYLEDRDANLTSQIHHLEDKDANLTSNIHYLENKDVNLTSQIHYLEDQNANLTSEIHKLQAFTACSGINHTVLSEDWRATSYTATNNHCDRTLPAGWYRFKLNGDNAVMPTSCVQVDRCGTSAPLWLDLQGQSLPGVVGQQVQARSCLSFIGVCCQSGYSRPVTVRNCGTFYIYNLQPTPTCPMAYCTTTK